MDYTLTATWHHSISILTDPPEGAVTVEDYKLLLPGDTVVLLDDTISSSYQLQYGMRLTVVSKKVDQHGVGHLCVGLEDGGKIGGKYPHVSFMAGRFGVPRRSDNDPGSLVTEICTLLSV